MIDVRTLREMFRHLALWRSIYASDGVDTLTYEGEDWSLWDIEYLAEHLDILPPRQREAIELCLIRQMHERDAAIQMQVSPTNPVLMYATSGLENLIRAIADGRLPRFRVPPGEIQGIRKPGRKGRKSTAIPIADDQPVRVARLPAIPVRRSLIIIRRVEEVDQPLKVGIRPMIISRRPRVGLLMVFRPPPKENFHGTYALRSVSAARRSGGCLASPESGGGDISQSEERHPDPMEGCRSPFKGGLRPIRNSRSSSSSGVFPSDIQSDPNPPKLSYGYFIGPRNKESPPQ